MNEGLIALATAICGLTGIGAAFSIGMATQKSVESAARQPEAADKIQRILILGASLIEATAIYAFILGLLLIFVR
ncbi:MAG TPA: ATP synthase F0 subunit C [Clostridiaceae bacterium]|jgi:F-type H+-transporting ATPase subunit c|nr:ATP synthase F0 subunit C [Clostridiaceae bacterium]